MPLSSNPIVKLVLFSSDPDRLMQFYVEKNLKFIAYTFSEQIHHISTNAGLVIIDRHFFPRKGNELNGFFTYSVQDTHPKWDVNGCTFCEQEELVVCNFVVPQEIHHQLPSVNEETWINILRHGDLEAAKLFFTRIGNWQQEQHGNGPSHYSLINHGNIFEIYPLLKKSSMRTEYIIQKHTSFFDANTVGEFFDPEGRRIRFIE
jgi:hypothetical protein